MEVRSLHIDDQEFAQLENDNISVFGSKDWIRIFDEKLELYGVYKSDKIVAYFYLYQTKLKTIKTLSNPPFTPHIGLCIKRDHSNASKANKFYKDVTKSISKYLNSRPEKIILLSLPIFCVDTQAFQWDSFKVVPRYTYRIDLNNNSLEQILGSMDSKTRSLVKKGEDQYPLIRPEKKELTTLISDHLTRNNAAQDLDLLEKIIETYANESNSYAVGWTKEKDLSAGALFVCDQETMYYLMGARSENLSDSSIGSSLIWSGIKKAKEMGLKTFDFEGSMIPEIERFFRGFGGEITPYYSVNKANILLEIPLKKKFKHIF